MKKLYSFIITIFILANLTSCFHSIPNNKLLSITNSDDGLNFTINPEANHKNIVFEVYNVTTGKKNVSLLGNNTIKNYKYPFVEKNNTYQIYAIFYNEKWDWITRTESEKINISPSSGKGNFYIDYKGFSYNGDRDIYINNYSIHKPDTNFKWVNAGVEFHYSSDKNKSPYEYHSSWDLIPKGNHENGSIHLTDDAVAVLQNKKYFWFKFRYSFSIDENTQYEYYINSEPLIFEYQKKNEFISTSKGDLKVSLENDGIGIYKDLDSFYKNIRIRVWDLTNNRNCPSICSDETNNSFNYPFVEKGCNYKIYMEAWDKDWKNYYKTESIYCIPENGYGNFIFSYSDAVYNDNDVDNRTVAQLILTDFFISNPLNEQTSNYNCTGNIYVDSSSYWNFYNFNNGVIDLSDYLGYFRQKDFALSLEYKFTCNNQEFEYNFISNNSKSFKDHHTAPALILNNDFQIINDFGTYAVEGANTGKNAFLITYNKSNNEKGDSTIASSRNLFTKEDDFESDCIICDLPKGQIINNTGRAAIAGPDYSKYIIGSTKHYFDGHEATLVATGNHCNIWFYDSNKESTQQLNNYINKNEFSFQLLSNYFDRYFEITTYVFGSHVPKLQYNNIITVTEDTKIDLFVTDLKAAGYNNSMGFYNGRNMYKNIGSNECEMVYIDVKGFLTYKWGILNIVMHEFQHLLTDVNKSFSYTNGGYDHDYTEMMSTACENILQTLYPEGIKTTTNGMVSGRMSGFNGGYMVGISNWGILNGNTNYNYGTNCAFIDFIMRYYGGVEVLRRISHNSFFNREAVVEAVKSMGYNETIDSLMMKFALCIVNSSLEQNQSAGGITAVKYTSTEADVFGNKVKFELMPLYYNWYTATDTYIYDSTYRYEKRWLNNYENKGPAIIDNSKNYSKIFPRSFNIKYLGKNLHSINIKNPGSDFIIGIAFN